MGILTHLETDTGSNADIHAASAIGTFTASADQLIMCDVSIDQVAGDGDYVMYVTRQIGGTGSSYVLLPKTTMAAIEGETAIGAQSGWITVRNGDVLTAYVVGLAGDTSTPDWSTRWFESASELDSVVIDTYTMRDLLTIMGAALAGKVTGGGTSTITFRGIDDASNVIVATVDGSGNRSALTLTV